MLVIFVLFATLFFSQAYRDLSFVSRDGLGLVVKEVHDILSQKFQKLIDLPKAQVKVLFKFLLIF